MSIYFDFTQTGKLSIEKTLFSSYYPILFTCRSDNGNLYLCVCCWAEKDLQKWLLSETEPATIIDMISDKITLRDAFLKDNKGMYTIARDRDGVEMITESDPSDWHPENSVLLPTTGEYMDADEGEFDEEINFYRLMQSREISNKIQTITLDFKPIPLRTIIDYKISLDEFNTIFCHRPGYEKGTSFTTYNATSSKKKTVDLLDVSLDAA